MSTIERIKEEIKKLVERAKAERVLHSGTILAAKNYLLLEDYGKLLSFIESLEKEQNDINIDKEIHKLIEDGSFFNATDNGKAAELFARHFYELGKNS